MEAVVVPFNKKKRAHQLGAVFLKEDRRWYIPDNIDGDAAIALRALAIESEDIYQAESTDTSGHTYMREQYYGKEDFSEKISCNIYDNLEETPYNIYGKKCNFSNEMTTLDAALEISKNGLPETAEERTSVLKLLGNRAPGQYPITYDGMIACSEEFAALYSPERLTELLKKCITGARYYAEEIRDADITEEEKALLMFALPL